MSPYRQTTLIFVLIKSIFPETSSEMWSSFEKYLGKVIPECIKKILSETGFDDDLALENLKETDIKDIEHYVNEHLPTLVNS